MQRILSDDLIARNAAKETIPYLLSSFGDLQRIDYGTGQFVYSHSRKAFESDFYF